jgi:hypothetical protein
MWVKVDSREHVLGRGTKTPVWCVRLTNDDVVFVGVSGSRFNVRGHACKCGHLVVKHDSSGPCYWHTCDCQWPSVLIKEEPLVLSTIENPDWDL